jgi:hypothetical protein
MKVDLLHAHGSPTNYRYGHAGCRCAVCAAAYRQFKRRYYLTHRDEQIAKYRRYYEANREHVLEHNRRWRDTNKERSKQRVRLKRYGLVREDFDSLLASQGGTCAVCKTAEPRGNGWCIDHCHQAGDVRGILCNNCNTAIGLFSDNPDHLRAAAEYIEVSR